MATDSSILAWRIPWTEEPSGLQSMRSHALLFALTLNVTSYSSEQGFSFFFFIFLILFYF